MCDHDFNLNSPSATGVPIKVAKRMWYHLKGIFIDITENYDSSLKVVA